MRNLVLRYTAYLLFAAIALFVWLFVFLLLGFAPGDPACVGDPNGCPPPSFVKQTISLLVIFGCIPLTVLVFIFFRRGIRRMLGMAENGYDR
jgi:hypothetical protein